MDIPQFTVKPDVARMVVPKIVQLVILSLLFYIALWLNLKLGFQIEVPLIVNVLIAIGLVLAVLVEVLRFHAKFSQYKYLFYVDKLVFQKKDVLTSFLFADFQTSKHDQNLIDRLMSTGTIVLNKSFKLGPVNKAHKVYEYLLKLISYYRSSRQQAISTQRSNLMFERKITG